MTNLQKAIKIGAICFAVFIIVNIVGTLMVGITVITGIDDLLNNTKETNIDGTIQTFDDLKSTSNIKIDISLVNLEIIEGDIFKIETESTEERVTVTEKLNYIKIEEKTKFFFNSTAGGTVRIYIPKTFEIESLEIDAGAGKITMTSINVNTFELDQGAGFISIENCNFGSSNIDGGAGNIEIKSSSLSNLDLDTGVGSVNISATLYGSSEIDCGVGEVNLTLLEGENLYTLYTEKGIGSIKINGENYSNNATYGNGANRVKISGGIGSINIDFN